MPPAVNTMVDDYAPPQLMIVSDWTMGIQRWLSRDDGSRTTMVDDGHTNKDQDEGKDDYDIRMPPAVNKMVDIKNTCDVPACWLLKRNENKIYILTDKSRDYCDTPCNFSYCTYVALMTNKKAFLHMPFSKMYQYVRFSTTMQQSYREQKFRSFSTYAVCKNVQVSKIFYNDATILWWTKI